MEPVTVEIGGRTIPLLFTMPEFMQIEEEIGSLVNIEEFIAKGKKRIRNTLQCIRIMGNAGLKKAGEKADLTDEWLEKHMKPLIFRTYQLAVVKEIQRGGNSEAEIERSENEERDLVMEELVKKNDPVNSHTDGSSTGA